MKLLTTGNPKTDRSRQHGYLTAVLHLAPHTLGRGPTVCPASTPGCRAACLNLAGRGGIVRHGETTNAIQRARIARTRFYHDAPLAFLFNLRRDIDAHVRAAARAGLKPAVRLNGTSDIAWENVASDLLETFPDVMFYDYTKLQERMIDFLNGTLPTNYDLTFSWGGPGTEDTCQRILLAGGRVAVPFADPGFTGKNLGFRAGGTVYCSRNPPPSLPDPWPIIDGDSHDLRFLDPPAVIVGLKAKGPARRDRTGFVVRIPS